MQLTLVPLARTEKSTVSTLLVNGVPRYFAIEDVMRTGPKVPGKTAIPAGTYEVVITHSPRFGVEMPLLLAVPGFKGIRIHTGNTAEDTEGCIVVGASYSSKRPDFVGESRLAYAALFRELESAIARGERVSITVTR